jgi:hypothetical protein
LTRFANLAPASDGRARRAAARKEQAQQKARRRYQYDDWSGLQLRPRRHIRSRTFRVKRANRSRRGVYVADGTR